jgi:hypothetical protein
MQLLKAAAVGLFVVVTELEELLREKRLEQERMQVVVLADGPGTAWGGGGGTWKGVVVFDLMSRLGASDGSSRPVCSDHRP